MISKEKLSKVFAVFDLDGTGYITKMNLASLLGWFDEDHSYIDDIVEEADLDGDGLISHDEFISAFLGEKT